MIPRKRLAWFQKKALPVPDNPQAIARMATLVVMFALKSEVIWCRRSCSSALLRRANGQPQSGLLLC